MTTATPSLSRTERSALCDLFEALGPDAPTLCGVWTTRELAAHLVVRERRPDLAPGLVVRRLRARLEAVTSDVAARTGWESLVRQVRYGPPAWNPMALPVLEPLVNTTEFYVHHEDVRRAAAAWEPRVLPEAAEEELWRTLRARATTFYRHATVGVILRRRDGVTWRAARGAGTVTVTGTPQELLLHAFGRTSVARVDVTGAPEDVTAFASTRLGV